MYAAHSVIAALSNLHFTVGCLGKECSKLHQHVITQLFRPSWLCLPAVRKRQVGQELAAQLHP